MGRKPNTPSIAERIEALIAEESERRAQNIIRERLEGLLSAEPVRKRKARSASPQKPKREKRRLWRRMKLEKFFSSTTLNGLGLHLKKRKNAEDLIRDLNRFVEAVKKVGISTVKDLINRGNAEIAKVNGEVAKVIRNALSAIERT